MNDPDVSIICAVLNEENHLPDLLDQIGQQTVPNLEIIFADGGSTDRTRAILDEASSRLPLTVIHNQGRIQAAGLNRALASASGTWIVRLDGHASIPSDYVERLVDLLDSSNAGVAGGRMVPRQPSGWIASGIALANCAWWGAGPAEFHRAGNVSETDTVYLGSFPRRLLVDLGGWNENLLTNEDYELNHRIRRSGRAVVLDPSIEVGYVPRSTLRSLARQYRRYGIGKAKMLARYPRSVRLRQLLPAALLPGIGGLALVRLDMAGALVMLHLTLLLALGLRSDIRAGLSGGLAGFVMHWCWSAGFWLGSLSPATWYHRSGPRLVSEALR
jgi:glycosyltransferase involved in cell wall biosynthesis